MEDSPAQGDAAADPPPDLDPTVEMEADPRPAIPNVTLTGEIGRGGMGVVYRGRQTYIDRDVAVKVMFAGGAESFEARFQREARILAGMHHPHIVACHQAGVTSDSSCFIVMELIEGPNLRAWIAEKGPADPAQAAAVCRDVAAALQYAHRSSIIHRDIKPANVLLQMRNAPVGAGELPFHVKLADLGLARPTECTTGSTMEITMQQEILGTPPYMAPEQFNNCEVIDFRADMYALGCVLYECLTGSLAFSQRTITAIIQDKVTGPPPDPREQRPDIPAPLAELAMKMLATDRAARPASYQELIDELQRCMTLAPKRRVPRPSKSWLLPVGIAATALVAGGIWFFASGDSKQDVDPGLAENDAPDPVDPAPPVIEFSVSAGDDIAVDSGATGRLSGVHPDPAGETVRVEWRPVDPAGAVRLKLSDPSALTTAYEAPSVEEETTLLYELSVSRAGEEFTDSVAITIRAAPKTEPEPDPEPVVVISPPDVSASGLVQADRTIRLDASTSRSFDGSGLLEYSWEELGTSRCELSESTSAIATATPPPAGGSFEFRVTVTDRGESTTDVVQIDVAPANRAPLASISAPEEVVAGEVITLDASASSDADGEPLTYRWSVVSGEERLRRLTDSAPERARFAAQSDQEAYDVTFALVASDEASDSLPVTHTVRVKQAPDRIASGETRGLLGTSGDPMPGWTSATNGTFTLVDEEGGFVEARSDRGQSASRSLELPVGSWQLKGSTSLLGGNAMGVRILGGTAAPVEIKLAREADGVSTLITGTDTAAEPSPVFEGESVISFQVTWSEREGLLKASVDLETGGLYAQEFASLENRPRTLSLYVEGHGHFRSLTLAGFAP